MKDVKIVYGDLKYFESFYETLRFVAQEKIYIEMIEPPPAETVRGFQKSLIDRDGAIFYAIDGERVVGWADVFPEENSRLSHRGSLGMGLLPDYRGQGIGTRLLQKVIEKARVSGLEKIELNVYTQNKSAIALYKNLGFEEEGLVKKYRRLEGQYFDCLIMAKFL